MTKVLATWQCLHNYLDSNYDLEWIASLMALPV